MEGDASMHGETTLLDELGIAHAVLRLVRDGAGEVRRASLLACSRAFSDQTSLTTHTGDRFLREAFGVGARTALAQFVDAARGATHVLSHYYTSSNRWFACYCRPSGDDCLTVVLIDVTGYRSDSALGLQREQAYRSFIEHLPMIAILRVTAPQPVSLFSAGSFREITGYGPEKGSSPESWLEIVHPDDRENVRREALMLVSEPQHESEMEYRIVRRDGNVRWVRSYERQFTSDDGTMQIVQGLILDVTDRKRKEEELREANDRIQEQNQLLGRLARTDALTGLLNRRAMQEQLERELRLLSRGRAGFSILLVDLDDFKGVNDRYGHRAGDRVLIHLAETLERHLRGSDVRSRWGGEEFMVLFTETSGEAALNVADKLRIWFAEHPTEVDGQTLPVTFTGGLVEATAKDTVDALFARADAALYQGKNAGRNRIVGILTTGATIEAPDPARGRRRPV